MVPKCTEELFDKIYIAVTHISQSLIDLLINKIVNKTFFVHNILDFPIFATQINDYTHTHPPFFFKQIVKTCATNISLTSRCSAS